jgi:predicted transcriptional regulator
MEVLPSVPIASDAETQPVDSLPLRPDANRWTFLTNHALVLVLLSKHPSIVLREVAARVGITERAVQRIIHELEQDGFIVREKVGRQNYYQIKGEKNLRHPIDEHLSIQELLDVIARPKP